MFTYNLGKYTLTIYSYDAAAQDSFADDKVPRLSLCLEYGAHERHRRCQNCYDGRGKYTFKPINAVKERGLCPAHKGAHIRNYYALITLIGHKIMFEISRVLKYT